MIALEMAEARGGGFRGGGIRRSPTFQTQPKYTQPRVSGPKASGSAAFQQNRSQRAIGQQGAAWPKIHSSLHPASPVTAMRGFTGQVTKSGGFIIEAKGRLYSVPQKGISNFAKSALLSSSALTDSPKKLSRSQLGAMSHIDRVTRLSGFGKDGKDRPVIIGHYPAYKHLADIGKYRHFQIHENYLKALKAKGKTQQEIDDLMWKSNERFLQKTVGLKREVVLATRWDQARRDPWGRDKTSVLDVDQRSKHSFFAKEIDFLLARGYRFNSDGTKMLPP